MESKLNGSRILPDFTVEIPTAKESPILDEDVSPSSPPSPPTPIQTLILPPIQTSPSTPIVSPPSYLPRSITFEVAESHHS